MKYYLVNFLVLANNVIRHDNTVAVAINMDIYDCTTAFKQQISNERKYQFDAQTLVIKTYKQISEDIYGLIHPFVKENMIPRQADPERAFISYKFQVTNFPD